MWYLANRTVVTIVTSAVCEFVKLHVEYNIYTQKNICIIVLRKGSPDQKKGVKAVTHLF